jgi:hypothetical protein
MSTASEPGRGVNNPIVESLGWVLTQLSRGRIPAGSSGGSVVLGAALFVALQLHDLYRWRGRLSDWSIHDEIAAWSRTLMLFLICWPRVHTWYLLPPLGLAIAAGPDYRRLFREVILLSCLSYVSYFH